MINHVHLRAFHAVAQAGSFTVAAQTLRISQPTLSEQVRALEKHYQVDLFTRTGRTIRLTPLGRELQQLTGQIESLEGTIARLLLDAQDPRSGELQLATDAPVHAVGLLAELERAHPGLRVVLSTGNSQEVAARVIGFQADVGITAAPPSGNRLHVEPLVRNDLVALIPTTHRLAKKRRVAVGDFLAERVILREPGSMTRQRFEQALATAGLTIDNVLVLDSREAVHEAVREGLGVSIVAEREHPADPRVRALPIAGLDLTLTEQLICRQERRHSRLIDIAFQTAHQILPMNRK